VSRRCVDRIPKGNEKRDRGILGGVPVAHCPRHCYEAGGLGAVLYGPRRTHIKSFSGRKEVPNGSPNIWQDSHDRHLS
jgi:hypothetical protein